MLTQKTANLLRCVTKASSAPWIDIKLHYIELDVLVGARVIDARLFGRFDACTGSGFGTVADGGFEDFEKRVGAVVGDSRHNERFVLARFHDIIRLSAFGLLGFLGSVVDVKSPPRGRSDR